MPDEERDLRRGVRLFRLRRVALEELRLQVDRVQLHVAGPQRVGEHDVEHTDDVRYRLVGERPGVLLAARLRLHLAHEIIGNGRRPLRDLHLGETLAREHVASDPPPLVDPRAVLARGEPRFEPLPDGERARFPGVRMERAGLHGLHALTVDALGLASVATDELPVLLSLPRDDAIIGRIALALALDDSHQTPFAFFTGRAFIH
ncbi:MAG TPA: hypothetical protein VHC69_33965, partial [Polyangiaceae bacterium]|nr:hypothetical protein [Polyangiaceae bacterium]